jgi:hypothetical protein
MALWIMLKSFKMGILLFVLYLICIVLLFFKIFKHIHILDYLRKCCIDVFVHVSIYVLATIVNLNILKGSDPNIASTSFTFEMLLDVYS